MTNYLDAWHIYEAADYIGHWLQKYARLNVTQYKEKWGEVRVYCNFGWYNLSCIIQPGWYSWRWNNRAYIWLASVRLPVWLSNLSYRVHVDLYRWRYARAVKKWPNLRDNILNGADYPEFLEGL